MSAVKSRGTFFSKEVKDVSYKAEEVVFEFGLKKERLTAPRLWINHGNFHVVNLESRTEFKTDVTATNNHSFAIFLFEHCGQKLISIYKLS